MKSDADAPFWLLDDNELLIQQDVFRWILRLSGWKSNEGSFLWVLLIFQRINCRQFKAVWLPKWWKFVKGCHTVINDLVIRKYWNIHDTRSECVSTRCLDLGSWRASPVRKHSCIVIIRKMEEYNCLRTHYQLWKLLQYLACLKNWPKYSTLWNFRC